MASTCVHRVFGGLAVAIGLAGGGLATSAPPAKSDEQAAQQKTSERLLELFARDAKAYTFYRDEAHQERLELRTKPVYVWLNPVRERGQQGAVYVWTFRGRPEALGSIFSNPGDGGRVVLHEFHTLSPAVIYPQNDSPKPWQPQDGIARVAMPEAPAPAATAKLRSIQLRALAREFSAHSVDHNSRTWELRVLPQPLYRYESDDPEILDGALLAFVTNAGTDPEILMVLEARQTREGPRWHYGLGRFSDFSLYVNHKDKQVWSAVRDAENPWDHDAPHRYHLHKEKVIPLELEATP